MKARSYLLAALGGLLFALAWMVPGTGLCALLGWLAALFFILFVRENSSSWYLPAYGAGLIQNSVDFYWLYGTIADFGGFPPLAALAIFILFVTLSAIQYLLFALFARHLPKTLDTWHLRTTLAWVIAECISVRIFPWYAGHTQVAFSLFAQSADILGTMLVSFILFWTAECTLALITRRSLHACAGFAVFLLSIFYGYQAQKKFASENFPTVKTVLVQGNISLKEKHDSAASRKNLERYLRLSEPFNDGETLIIWPETVVMDFVHDRVGSVDRDPRLPFWRRGTKGLIGSLSFLDQEHFFNSAFAIYGDRTVPEPYHKVILMPFGEYTPFGETFPWLADLNATAAQFVPGSGPMIFNYPNEGEKPLRVAPLICYEDVVSSLALDAVQQNATLLVNITNDAWFGDTVASRQHHLIASFRAIETRRYLLRATNTGYTAVVDPLGKTSASLEPFTEGVLPAQVQLIDYHSLLTVYRGDRLWWILSILSACVILYRKAIK